MLIKCYQQPFPTLRINDDYILREQSVKDTDAFFRYYADPDVSKHILATTPSNIAQAKEEIQYCRNLFYIKRGLYWTIADSNTDEMIGAIGLYINNQHHRAEISYDLSKTHWRKGIMTKAIATVIDHCFNEMDIQRLEAVTIKDNSASIAILDKLGFTHEATLENYRYFKEQPHTIELFGMTPTSWTLYKNSQQL